ncbi:MAG: proteasome accessory factor PafA2 family protein [bacterium]|nr:proteasome accessory factor PafA2 family protein [bacterium]MDZ4285910.1 proteasome accessory factor PafA2 family protein [Candidatus Sungbacteria bacterium]
MLIRDRIYGVETEFGSMILKESGEFVSTYTLVTAHYYAHLGSYPGGVFLQKDKKFCWHENGSLTYVDFNDHPEHATAEYRSIRGVVAGLKAGERIMNDMFASPMPGTKDYIILYKNNLGWNDQGDANCTFGFHENYSLSLPESNRTNLHTRLISFLVTRQILDGSGTWDKNGTFLLSQRAKWIERITSEGATFSRALISTKPTMDTGYRLQLICGDSNMLETAAFLKIGTTAIVLALAEQGISPPLQSKYPIQALYNISESADPHGKFFHLMGNGGAVSALDVQYEYLKLAKHFLPEAEYESEKTCEEFTAVIALWEQALDAIAGNDKAWMVGRLDYATKKYLFEQAVSKMPSGSSESDLRKSIDIMYHDIRPGMLHDRIKKRMPHTRMLSDGEILAAKVAPPLNTRAYLRARFIAKMREAERWIRPDIEWNQCSFHEGGLNTTFRIPDPFCSQSDAFEDFLAKIVP